VLVAAAATALVVVGAAMLVGTGGPTAALPGPLPGAATALAADLPAVRPAPARAGAVPAARPAIAPAPAAPARAVAPAPAGSTGPTMTATPTPAARPKPTTAKAAALVSGTPCTVAAKACVDLADREAWLLDDGSVARGPVHVMAGDQDDPTPTGTFHVQWKAEQYTSRQYLVQMPYSVFFADGGIAFHEGNPETASAGCVKLDEEDARAFFTYLQVGDAVQIV
jgi:lipoprotein-anchoring transpeptidase ErfK/SrfK